MELTMYELKLYMDDDYRENVLKSCNSKDIVREMMEESK